MNRPAGGRLAGGAGGGSAGARGAILLVVAAVLGIILLQSFDTGGGGGSVVVGGTTVPNGGGSSGSTIPAGGATVTTTTVPSRAPSEVVVLVANGTGIKGLGGQTADALKALAYNTPTAVDATKSLESTTVQYAEGYEAEARSIAVTLGLQPTAVVPLNSPAVPDTAGVNVFVLLGGDIGGTTTTIA